MDSSVKQLDLRKSCSSSRHLTCTRRVVAPVAVMEPTGHHNRRPPAEIHHRHLESSAQGGQTATHHLAEHRESGQTPKDSTIVILPVGGVYSLEVGARSSTLVLSMQNQRASRSRRVLVGIYRKRTQASAICTLHGRVDARIRESPGLVSTALMWHGPEGLGVIRCS